MIADAFSDVLARNDWNVCRDEIATVDVSSQLRATDLSMAMGLVAGECCARDHIWSHACVRETLRSVACELSMALVRCTDCQRAAALAFTKLADSRKPGSSPAGTVDQR